MYDPMLEQKVAQQVAQRKRYGGRPFRPVVVNGQRPAVQHERPPQYDLSDKVDRVLDRMKLVKRARFNAHKRLERKHQFGLFAFSVLSLGVIGLSVIKITHASLITPALSQHIDFVTIILSVFVIIVGLVEGGNNFMIKAAAMHDCALKINRIQQLLEANTIRSDQELQDQVAAYQTVLKDCPYNHDDVDHRLAKLAPRALSERFSDRLDYYWAKAKYLSDIYLWYTAFILLPFAVFLLPF